MRTLALWIIAVCLFAQTFDVYQADTGGINIYFGSFGYHIAD
jgi:hypothetical protein